jgi:hypothetical protein
VYVVARSEEAEQGACSTRPRREPQVASRFFVSLVIGNFRGELVVLFYFPCGNDEDACKFSGWLPTGVRHERWPRHRKFVNDRYVDEVQLCTGGVRGPLTTPYIPLMYQSRMD